MKNSIIKIILALLGIVTGGLFVRIMLYPPFRPSKYIEIHDNRGISIIEAVIYISLGSVITFITLAVLHKYKVI